MEDSVNYALFNVYWDLVLGEILDTSVHIFFYAIFLILFIIAIRNLGRRETAGKSVLLTFSWALAALGTAQAVLCISRTIETLRLLNKVVKQGADLNPGPVPARTYILLGFAEDVVFVVNNLTADLLFLYRCYVIWGPQKKVLVVPGTFILSTVVLGCISSTQALSPISTAVYTIGAATNLTLVAFTAGRIWLKQRDAIHIDTNSTLRNRYSTVIAMIVESGALYCFFAILCAITSQIKEKLQSAIGDITFGVTVSASAQGMNILPTVIIVRAGMGHNIQDRIEPLCVPRPTPGLPIVKRVDLSCGVLDIEPSGEQKVAKHPSTIV
ncbi:hypothetical protein K438DRAFT_1887081 [Mycena galopus ATCC 62051]|nr:hypothetical protein K438DRAFT_1887081 [Mycena galopus ATCC 62051]